MKKEMGQNYKHSQYQISTSSMKEPVISSSETQISSAIKLTTTYIPSETDKHQNNCEQRHPIIMTDADYDYILDEIERREKIDSERNVSGNSDEE